MWNLRQYGNKVALYSKEYGEISYEEMAGISEEISGNITGRELVCVITENSVECLCGYIGFINNRIVPLMIDKTNAEWIHNLIDHTSQITYGVIRRWRKLSRRIPRYMQWRTMFF